MEDFGKKGRECLGEKEQFDLAEDSGVPSAFEGPHRIHLATKVSAKTLSIRNMRHNGLRQMAKLLLPLNYT